ncbi:MAG: nucleoside triphosphate pyrophosphohydrolase [Rhodospirillales bacterium]|nr:nucleoside triphosphate pyrophosphohydrolase [Rhodospirillales bacterium]MBO6786865.1 nucleoside triphosphate pyrophosphohydrolase [Rhodospirillales bacterium]
MDDTKPSPNPAWPTETTDDLLRIMAKLRDPDGGCPWDVEQDFATIAPYTIEEAYEVADAIEQNDMESLKGELGDLLLQVVFHAQMAAEAGHFDYADVVHGISEKMVVRHPHVFGDVSVEDADAQTRAWEDQKAAERAKKAEAEGRTPSVLDDVARGLPALMRAEKLQKRAARVGFDWPTPAPVFDKVREELDEVRDVLDAGGDPATVADRLEDELGDLLFTCVNLARKLGADPETALRRTISKFERRFRAVEEMVAKDGKSMKDYDIDGLEAMWVKAKATD